MSVLWQSKHSLVIDVTGISPPLCYFVSKLFNCTLQAVVLFSSRENKRMFGKMSPHSSVRHKSKFVPAKKKRSRKEQEEGFRLAHGHFL